MVPHTPLPWVPFHPALSLSVPLAVPSYKSVWPSRVQTVVSLPQELGTGPGTQPALGIVEQFD